MNHLPKSAFASRAFAPRTTAPRTTASQSAASRTVAPPAIATLGLASQWVASLRFAALVLALILLSSSNLDAQTNDDRALDSSNRSLPATAAVLARADSLFAAGARDDARDAYRSVLAIDSLNSRATFRLAQLAPAGSDESIALYIRYTELEDGDAWGWISLAEAYADAGEIDEAIDAYDEALERSPGERDAVVGREGLLALVDDDTDDALNDQARATESLDAPSLQPSVGGSIDSDGNSVTRVGLAGDVSVGGGSRLGIQLERMTASGDGEQSVDRGLVTYSLRGSDGFRLDVRGGVSIREDAQGELSKSIEPVGRLRSRWFGDEDDLGLELRLQRTLQDATPELIENGTVLEEALVALDVPMGNAIHLRVLGSGGALVEGSKRNWRFRVGGGPQYLVMPGVRLGAQYEGTKYTGRGKGYYAPSIAHTIEATAYAEVEELGQFSLAADVGAGIQQVVEEKGGVGTLSPALRGWGSVAWNFARSSSLSLELEGYNVVGSAAVAGVSSGWSYGAATLSLRWAL